MYDIVMHQQPTLL